MTTMRTEGVEGFESRTSGVLSELETGGQLKRLQMIEGPMGPSIQLRGRGTVDCFCSNNYLGLANHPEVVEAGVEEARVELRQDLGEDGLKLVMHSPALALLEDGGGARGVRR